MLREVNPGVPDLAPIKVGSRAVTLRRTAARCDVTVETLISRLDLEREAL